MPLAVDAETVAKMEKFLEYCMVNPAVLHQPELASLKKFVEHLGGKIPDPKPDDSDLPKKNEEAPMMDESEPVVEPESEESDLELDMTGVIEPDADEPQEMGDPALEPTEEQITESQTKRSEAVSAFMEKDYDRAVQLYTEAIVLNPQASLLYAKRGQVYLLQKKPNACIRDCDRALELNPDSAAAHKFRGRAYHLLGKWEEAANDLRLACKFDFDEQADEWLREVTPNARKIQEHKRKKERKQQEKQDREKQERLKNARESHAKAKEDNAKAHPNANSKGGSQPDMNSFFQFLNDPEIRQGFADPEVVAAFEEISVNPAEILKYQSNPKIMSFINKMVYKFGIPREDLGAFRGGFPAGFPGGMPGGTPGSTPGSTGAPTDAPKPPKPHDDVGLD